jgi:5'-3' exonuclease
MKVYLVDGTYELFRHFYALPSHTNRWGEEVAAVRGVIASMFSLLEEGVTHIAIATDHVIESFRNTLWPHYKDGSGIDPRLRSQFQILEEALQAAGFMVWPMVEFEADDALAAGAMVCTGDERVEQVIICTPDKDLAQCVLQDRVVQLDRRRQRMFNHSGVIEKFGVEPEFIPDYLALVGDAADGYPGLRGWGPKSAVSVIRHYGHLEQIPPGALDVPIKSADSLGSTFSSQREMALLFRRLATLVREGVIDSTVDELRWNAASEVNAEMYERLESPPLLARARSLSGLQPNNRAVSVGPRRSKTREIT